MESNECILNNQIPTSVSTKILGMFCWEETFENSCFCLIRVRKIFICIYTCVRA